MKVRIKRSDLTRRIGEIGFSDYCKTGFIEVEGEVVSEERCTGCKICTNRDWIKTGEECVEKYICICHTPKIERTDYCYGKPYIHDDTNKTYALGVEKLPKIEEIYVTYNDPSTDEVHLTPRSIAKINLLIQAENIRRGY